MTVCVLVCICAWFPSAHVCELVASMCMHPPISISQIYSFPRSCAQRGGGDRGAAAACTRCPAARIPAGGRCAAQGAARRQPQGESCSSKPWAGSGVVVAWAWGQVRGQGAGPLSLASPKSPYLVTERALPLNSWPAMWPCGLHRCIPGR